MKPSTLTKYTLQCVLITASLLGLAAPVNSEDKKFVEVKPAPADPLPDWTGKADAAPSDQQVHIQVKFIEITRSVDDPEIPEKRYEKQLTDTQFQAYIRELSEKKGVDLMTAPSLVARGGQNATIQVIKEMIYPVGPGKDAELETENVGVTSYLKTCLDEEGKILVQSFSRISELEGFFKVTPEFDLPVFRRRDVETSTHLANGNTIVVGGIVDESTSEDVKKGRLGLIEKRISEKQSRELIITLSARLIRPDGRPVK